AVVVQPLHIFTGEEYEEVLSIVKNNPSVRSYVGTPLFAQWSDIYTVVDELKRDFLKPEEGVNIVVAHGTPTVEAYSNVALLGLDRLFTRHYSNVYLGAVDGVITRSDALGPAKLHPAKRARFHSLMLVSGDHIMNDIMGEEKDSWKSELAVAGFAADSVTVSVDGESLYKGLGFFESTTDIFISKIRRSMEKAAKE
ncbi:hypothetical protein FDZ71_01685, partial [bacterium]